MKQKILNNNWFWVGTIFVVMFFAYLVEIQVWNLTSQTYKPSGLIDNVSRAPKDVDDWFVRREHGVCPFDFRLYDIKKPFQGFEDC